MKSRLLIASLQQVEPIQCFSTRPSALVRPFSCSPRSHCFSRAYSSLIDQASDDVDFSGLANPTQSRKWLSSIKERIGKCILFGLQPEQVNRAAEVLKVIAWDWKDLVAGSEGFLTSKDKAGLIGHRVSWGEMDSLGHINNVTHTRYAESARCNWVRNLAIYIDPYHKKEWSEILTSNGTGLILRSIKTEYKFPMTWPDKVSIYHKIRHLPGDGEDSFLLDVLILSERHQRVAARCEEDIVMYDYQQGRETTLRPFVLDTLKGVYLLQGETKLSSARRILTLLKQVESLEKESWNRDDAEENLGAS